MAKKKAIPVSPTVIMTDEQIDLIVSWNVRFNLGIKNLDKIDRVADIVVPMLLLLLRGR